MSDEVWCDIVFDDKTFLPTASLSQEIAERTFTVKGFSKNYGLAGLRIGALICPSPEIAEAVAKSSKMTTTMSGASTLSQIAAVAALSEPSQEYLKDWVLHLQDIRDAATTMTVSYTHLRAHET